MSGTRMAAVLAAVAASTAAASRAAGFRAAVLTAAALTAAVLTAVVLTACTATTSGRGTTLGSPTTAASTPTSAASSPSASTPSTPAASSSGAAAPVAVPPPAACPGGTCHQDISASLSSPYTVFVRTNPDYASGQGAAIVELTDGSVPVFWAVLTGEMPVQLTCISAPGRSNCVLVDDVGAHGSDAIVWRLNGNALQRGSTVTAATPEMQARDLNGDGWVDVVGLQNTYQPDYATGQVYWQSWLSDGLRLTSSGCGTPSHSPPAAPTAPLTGRCP